MPIDFNKKQTIDELTGGRIKRKPREEETTRTAGKGTTTARATAAKKGGSRR